MVAQGKIGRDLSHKEVVHHIDGQTSNNLPSNLMVFTTQRDHAFFHTSGIAYLSDDGSYTSSQKNKLCQCGMPTAGILCMDCNAIKQRKVKDRPDKETLLALIKSMPYIHIGKLYRVSDNAIRKWALKYGINPRFKQAI